MISTIIPIYHGQQYIEKQLKQLENAACQLKKLSGRYDTALEVLFVNDAPDDPIGEELHSDVLRVRVFNTDTNRGIHGARVWGLSKASGEFVHFLDQDDEISPDFYMSQLDAIGDADVVYCRGYNGRQEIYNTSRVFEKSFDRDEILKCPPMISVGQALLRREEIPKLWVENILKNNGSDDYFLWLSYVSDKKTFALNEELLFRHTRVGGNFSSDIVRARESDEEMVQLLLDIGSFSEEERKMLKALPEVLFTNRYGFLLKEQQFLLALDALLWCRERGNGLGTYLKSKDISSVAVYGAGILGQRLADMLIDDGISVECFIDRNADFIAAELPVYTPESLPVGLSVDGVVISLLGDTKEIEELIKKKVGRKEDIIPIQDVLARLESESFESAIGWDRR